MFLRLAIALSLLSNVLCYITWIAVRLPLKGERSPPGSPWPLPREWRNSSTVRTIDPRSISISSTLSCDVLDAAISRYKRLVSLDAAATPDGRLSVLKNLDVKVTGGCEKYPRLESVESYTLSLSTENSAISSATIWGALRGLETFSQLVYVTDEGKLRINDTVIVDSPRYKHRGIMLDTARHFLPVDVIKANLDAMSWNKMNVFHWHVVDDQSFPFPSRVFPKLTLKGSYTNYLRYSFDDVKSIIEYARLRGIRVIPEFDTPGHTFSWGKAYLDLLTPCWGQGRPGTPDYPKHGAYEIFNPTLNSTYDFMDRFLGDVSQIFPDKHLHLGMDEVYYACWKSNPNISDFMNSHNMSDHRELLAYYAERVIKIARGHGVKVITWQDPLDYGVDLGKDKAVVEVWKKPWQNQTAKVASKGYRMILSAPWYLNYISYGQDWRNYYEIEPTNYTGGEQSGNLIQGGEACIWAEYVDHTNLLPRLWPRASAVAERLWSPKTARDTESAKFRLDEQRCRMVRRGIPAQPILNGYCRPAQSSTAAPELAADGKQLGVFTLFSVVFLLY